MKNRAKKTYSLKKTHRIKKRQPIYRSKIFWAIIAAVISLSSAIYLLFFFKFFWISSIDVLGTQKTSIGDIARIVDNDANCRFVFFSRSIFLFSAAKTRNKLKELYPVIEEITITKKLPNALAVNIRERSAVALWLNGDNYYQIDGQGIIFLEADKKDRLVIRQLPAKGPLLNLGERAANKETMNAIIKIDQSLKRDSGLTAQEAVIENSRITVVTTGGWDIYFDLENDITWQLEKLKAVLNKQIPSDLQGSLEYIDVRFGNLAPYRYRDK